MIEEREDGTAGLQARFTFDTAGFVLAVRSRYERHHADLPARQHHQRVFADADRWACRQLGVWGAGRATRARTRLAETQVVPWPTRTTSCSVRYGDILGAYGIPRMFAAVEVLALADAAERLGNDWFTTGDLNDLAVRLDWCEDYEDIAVYLATAGHISGRLANRLYVDRGGED